MTWTEVIVLALGLVALLGTAWAIANKKYD